MSDSERPAEKVPGVPPTSQPNPPNADSPGGPEEKPAAPSNQANGATEDPREELLRTVDKSLLTPELKAQILAELPPPEEMARLYRELQENGGLSSEEFLESVFRDIEPQP
jgi:hypothetical protein